jgi:hypothetical protein
MPTRDYLATGNNYCTMGLITTTLTRLTNRCVEKLLLLHSFHCMETREQDG